MQSAGRRFTAPITVPVEPELDKFLEIYAAFKGASKAEIVRRMIYEYLYRRGFAVKLDRHKYALAPDAIEKLARRIARIPRSP